MMSVGQRRAMMPVNHPSPGVGRVKGKPSRLEALQTDFQNKMLREKEERLLKHLDNEKVRQQKTLDRYQDMETIRQDSSFSAPGGVRTFFNERKKKTVHANSAGSTNTYQTRKKEGYDKSRPLEPINHNTQNNSPSRLPVRGFSDPSIIHSSKVAKKPTDFEKWRTDQDMLDRQRRVNAANKNHTGDHTSGYSTQSADRYQSEQLELQSRRQEEELERRAAAAAQRQQEEWERQEAAVEKQEEVRGQRSVIKQKQEEKRRLQAEKGRRRRDESERRQQEVTDELRLQNEARQAELDEQAETIKQLEEQLKEKQKDLQDIQKRKPREVDASPEPYQQTSRSEASNRHKKQQQNNYEDDLPPTKPKKVTRRDVKPRPVPNTNSAEHSPRPTKAEYSPSKPSTRAKSRHELNTTYQISREQSIPIITKSIEEREPFVIDGDGLDIDLSPCAVCGRNFASDRVAKHQKAFKKVSKPRKQFNVTAQRLAGSGAEKFQHRSKQASQNSKKPARQDWRAKREEFIASIRYAKMAAAVEAKGGNVAELPPPPKSENPDYVQCPHCSRRFNESVAERHIPKCQSIKAKPSMLKKGTRR